MYLLLEYPKCSTCQRAKKWLSSNKIQFELRNIKEEPPTTEELTFWIHTSKLPVKKFFNTSGLVYKDMELKNKLPDMTEQEQIELLSSNGMLVKRPLFINEASVLIGFKEEEWKSKLL